MSKNPEFQKHFVRPIMESNAEYPLVYIEILAGMAETSPSLQTAMIEAVEKKADWYSEQASGMRAVQQLNNIANPIADSKGESQ